MVYMGLIIKGTTPESGKFQVFEISGKMGGF